MKWCCFCFLCLPFLCFAQSNMAATHSNAPAISRFSVTLEWQSLYSTHGNFFHGGSVLLATRVGHGWQLGGGVEYSYAPFHDDNGWKLYHLKFLPVYADVKYYVAPQKRTGFYLHVASGLSFVHYKKEDENTWGHPYPVSEKGWYLYGGGGLHYPIFRHLQGLAEAGIKGFHMSFNALDVNPHGLVFRTGLQYHL